MSFSMIGRGDPLLLPDEAPICAVTGGTGAVGKALVRQLASDLPHHRLVLLTRRPERSQTNNITSVFADITLPDLGLAPHTTRLLEQRAEFFFHCAADTRFNLPVEEARQVNTEGTRHTLALARGCRNLRHFAH
ncbi:MAG TPA: SDR family oxidoreductase, partial [Bryobacteraceae bacterium]|nr:SDR family oxidoreductase [Bryobacteraceae bacterium]